MGAPIRLGSISGGRFDLAPDAVRGALVTYSTFADGIDVRAVAVKDAGDLAIAGSSPEAALREIAGSVGGTLDTYAVAVVLGGDNSITRPACRGLGPDLSRVGLLTLDAHHDLRDTSDGLTNGNPIRALLEDGLPGENVVQVGIQPFANSAAYANVARGAGITVVTADEVRTAGINSVVQEALLVLASRADAIYVDLDLDVLDRAFAPACPGSRPGGLAPWEVLAAARLAGAHPKVRAIDLVEVDPERDVADVTVLTAAACLLSFAAGVATRGGEG
ncbi:MAG TPA: agmatinase family protein [Actinomycetota bacterium]|nr:agmatinase family protein [Actinomycetota bacterium]